MLATMKKAAMNSHVQVFEGSYRFIALGVDLGIELLNHYHSYFDFNPSIILLWNFCFEIIGDCRKL